jgi:cytochrome c biogenesis protein CcmG/thiol:disulfide interchange protein DsbE
MNRVENPKYLLPLFFAIGILIGFFLILTKEEEDNFIAFDLPKDAQFISLQEGKILPLSFIEDDLYAINIFATWCESCVKEYPLIEELSGKIPIYGLNYNDSIEDMKEFFAQNGNCYKDIFLDPHGEAMRFFGTSLIPEIFIISNGKVIYRITGKLTEEIISKKILPRISKKSK